MDAGEWGDDAMEGALQDYWRLIDSGQPFEAHEVLEPAWRQAEGPPRLHLKGLIQLAAALHHADRGNRHGAAVKLRSGMDYIRLSGLRADPSFGTALELLEKEIRRRGKLEAE